MEVTKTKLGLYLIKIDRRYDERGFFNQIFQEESYRKAGLDSLFVQDNLSYSRYSVTRGLHYQKGEKAQSKLIQVINGEVFDVAVNIDKDSKDYGKSESFYLKTDMQILIPANFAHGFQCLSEDTHLLYKCSNVYSKDHERTIIWNDPKLNINWPIKNVIISDKDALGEKF